MRRRIIKFLRLLPSERWLFIKSAMLLGVVRLGLLLLPFKTLLNFIENVRPKTIEGNNVHKMSPDQIAWAVKVASRYIPFARCLCQAMVVKILFTRHGYPAQLRIGVVKSDDEKLKAHAWVESQGRIVIGNGREITIQPARHFDEQMIQAVIINAIMAVVLFQREILVFHASCVRINDAAIAFLGTSGAGKSLIAGALVARGHYLIAEDVAPVDLIPAQPRVYPGYPMIRIKSQDSAILGLSDQCNKLLHAKEQRCQCFVRDSFTALPCPLRYIFVLAVNERRKIQRLTSKESFMELISHSPPAIWNLLPDQLHFSNLGKLIEKVPVFRVTREECLEALPEHARMIEEYFYKNVKRIGS